MALNTFSIIAMLIFVGINLICLLIGFKMGRSTTIPFVQPVKMDKEGKPQSPYIEDVTEDPWNVALTPDTGKDKKPKIVGGM